MAYGTNTKRSASADFSSMRVPNFDRRVREAMKVAPEVRAQAIKDFWGWFVGNIR